MVRAHPTVPARLDCPYLQQFVGGEERGQLKQLHKQLQLVLFANAKSGALRMHAKNFKQWMIVLSDWFENTRHDLATSLFSTTRRAHERLGAAPANAMERCC